MTFPILNFGSFLKTTLTASAIFSGLPVPGSIMWPAESFPSKLAAVCSEVDTLPSVIMTCGATLFEGSRKCKSHPLWPGGDPIAKIVLPPASIKAS